MNNEGREYHFIRCENNILDMMGARARAYTAHTIVLNALKPEYQLPLALTLLSANLARTTGAPQSAPFTT